MAIDNPDPLAHDDFWDALEPLARIKAWAHARGSAPAAVLTHSLLRAITVTPPNVVLPPIVGDVASLNLFASFVANSGGGKNVSRKVARLAVRTPTPYVELPVGSGEGIARAYAYNETQNIDGHDVTELKWKARALMFRTDEVSGLAALASRSGSTLGAALKQGAMGEALGNAYADSTKAVIIPDHEYRMTYHVAVQPALSGAMFADQAGGFPQRFVWAQTVDPTIPLDATHDPEPWFMHPRDWGTGQVVLDVPQQVWDIVSTANRAKARGDYTELDGHALLTQEKVAAGIMLLDNRTAITWGDWLLAECVMRHSDIARQLCHDAMKAERLRRADEKGEAIARTNDAVARSNYDRVLERVLEKTDADMTLTLSKLKQSFNSRDRDIVEVVVSDLREKGHILPGMS